MGDLPRLNGMIGALEACSRVAPRLADSHWSVRPCAALALRRLGVRGSHELETAMSDSGSPTDRRLARYVLSLETDALLDQGVAGALA